MEPDLVDKIKDWLQIDKDINQLMVSLKDKKKEKKDLTDLLMQLMKQKEIEMINLNDGSIELKSNKVKAPLNKKHLFACLNTYFGETEETATKVDEIMKHILTSRDEKIKEFIKRTKTKSID
jgi:hypothetical protein